MRWLMIPALLLLTGCAAFDMADLQHAETLSQDTIIDADTLQDAGFTTEQIDALRESVKVEIKTTSSSAKVRGKPAGEFEMTLPGMALSVRDIIDPASMAKYLYIGAVAIAIMGLLAGKFFGWGITIGAMGMAAGLVVLGRISAMPYAGISLLLLSVAGGIGYVLWRLHRGKAEHRALWDVADVLKPSQIAKLPKKDRIEIEKNKSI